MFQKQVPLILLLALQLLVEAINSIFYLDKSEKIAYNIYDEDVRQYCPQVFGDTK